MPTREQEWQRIFDGLTAFLQPFGKNSIYPAGDLWLVDDDWGEAQQKICILNPDVLTPDFVLQLQAFLRDVAPAWAVVLAMDIDDPRMPEAGMGVTVTADKVSYDWDLALLRGLLGKPAFFPDRV